MRRMITRIILLAIVVMGISCSSDNEYTNALPKDVSVVVTFDLEQMAVKGGLNGEAGERLVKKLGSVVQSGLEGEARQTVEKVLANHSESGLSLKDDVYLFVTPGSKVFGLVAKVSDEGKLEDLMQMRVDGETLAELKNEGNCRWMEAGRMICAFNSNTFLMMIPTKGRAIDLKNNLLYLMRQEAKESFTATTGFEKLESAEGEISVVADMSVMPDELTMQVRMGLPADLQMKDLKSFLDVSFEKGKIVIDAENLIESTKVKNYLAEQWEYLSPIKGSYMECYPAATPIWMGTRVDGKGLYDLLCQHPVIGQELKDASQTVDLQSILSAIDGDVAFGLTSLKNGDLIAYADVKGSEFMQTFEELRAMLEQGGSRMMQLVPTGENQYELRISFSLRVWFGVKDKVLYFSTNKQLADEAGRRYGVSLTNTPWADQVDDNCLFLALNTQQIVEGLQKNPLAMYMMRSLKKEASVLFEVLSMTDYLTSGVSDWKSNHTEIVMKDKDTNVLEVIVRALDNL